jgi:hypothetical protein
MVCKPGGLSAEQQGTNSNRRAELDSQGRGVFWSEDGGKAIQTLSRAFAKGKDG